MLNSSDENSTGSRASISLENLEDYKREKNEVQQYLKTLRYNPIVKPKKGKPSVAIRKNSLMRHDTLMRMRSCVIIKRPKARVIHSTIGTGFESLFYGLESAYLLAEFLIKSGKQKVCIQKTSQDHLEQFFSCIRGRNGYNSHPSCRLFTASYKALMLQTEIKISTGNTSLTNAIPILQMSSQSKSNYYCYYHLLCLR